MSLLFFKISDVNSSEGILFFFNTSFIRSALTVMAITLKFGLKDKSLFCAI